MHGEEKRRMYKYSIIYSISKCQHKLQLKKQRNNLDKQDSHNTKAISKNISEPIMTPNLPMLALALLLSLGQNLRLRLRLLSPLSLTPFLFPYFTLLLMIDFSVTGYDIQSFNYLIGYR